MRVVLRAMWLGLLAALAVAAGGLVIGYAVLYWSHVSNWIAIVVGIGGIVCLTMWSDH